MQASTAIFVEDTSEMSTLESNKNLALIGSILLIIGTLIPWGGFVVDIIGIILFMMAIRGFSDYYRDTAMYQNAFTGIIYYIIAAIAAAVAVGSLSGAVAVGLSSLLVLGLGIVTFVVALIIAFIFFVLAASRLRRTFYDLSQRTGEQSFHTAGTLLWIGALLTIVFGIGLILIFIAWIFAALGFFSMRVTSTPNQPYYSPPPPASTVPPTAQATKYCPNCGQPVDANATFCPHCGKQLPPA